MNAFFSAFQSIGPLFLVIFVGMVVSRNKSVDDKWLEILNNYALCMKYELNSEFASRAVVISTLLALLSLPFWLVFLN